MGSVQSARRAQPGRGVVRGGDGLRRATRPVVAPPAVATAARARAPSLRGRAPRPAPDRTGAAPGEGTPSARTGSIAPGGREGTPLRRPRAATRAVTREGPRERAPRMPRARARPRGLRRTSATHPTRLETRTKESNARASQRVTTVETPWRNESEGRRAPAEVGSRPRGAGRTTGPSRPLCRGGGA